MLVGVQIQFGKPAQVLIRLLYDVMGSRSAFMLSAPAGVQQHNSRIRQDTPAYARASGWRRREKASAAEAATGSTGSSSEQQRTKRLGANNVDGQTQVGAKRKSKAGQKEERETTRVLLQDWPISTQPCREALHEKDQIIN